MPESAISCANNYFTIFQGILYKHYDENVDRNTFYGNYTDSSVKVVLNESPGSVKSFHTLDYEGSQSRIVPMVIYDGEVVVNDQLVLGNELLEDQYYNLTAKDGWYVDSFITDKEKGSLNELRANLARLTTQRNAINTTTKQGATEFKRLNKEILSNIWISFSRVITNEVPKTLARR